MPITHLSSTGTGTFTLTNPVSASNRTITYPDATTTLVGTDTTQTLTNKTIQGGVITKATAITTTSGTSHLFTGIPSWAERITVILNEVSTSGGDRLLVQLGSAGGIVSTGYVSTAWQGSSVSNSSTAGFLMGLSGLSDSVTAIMTLVNITGNVWVSAHTGKINTSTAIYGAGSLAVGATVTQLQITTTGGTQTFDAGTINIMYEG